MPVIAEPSLFPALSRKCGRGGREAGSIIFYILLSIALLAALTFSFTKNSRENVSVQASNKMAQELYVQANLIRSAIAECAMTYPGGGPDTNADGSISAAENPNNPYPLLPTSASNLIGAASDNSVVNADGVHGISCIGAPSAAASSIFVGAGNSGRFLPPAPGGFGSWTYATDANGVYIQIIASASNNTAISALTQLRTKFAMCQAEINFATCGANCFTAWILRVTAAACL